MLQNRFGQGSLAVLCKSNSYLVNVSQQCLRLKVELLGVTVDNKLKFEGQIKKICRKVSH